MDCVQLREDLCTTSLRIMSKLRRNVANSPSNTASTWLAFNAPNIEYSALDTKLLPVLLGPANTVKLPMRIFASVSLPRFLMLMLNGIYTYIYANIYKIASSSTKITNAPHHAVKNHAVHIQQIAPHCLTICHAPSHTERMRCIHPQNNNNAYTQQQK